MPFTLPELPYAQDALEPHVDAKTMEIHRTKHHAAYGTNANKALEGTPVAEASVEDVCRKFGELAKEKHGPVRNNAGGAATSRSTS